MQNRKPMVLVFAGPNGSGKTTITQFFEKVGSYTNADEIVASIGVTNEEAMLIADRKRYEAIANHEDFSFETVLSSRYKLDILEKAKAEGYFIKCVFVLTSNPAINVQRVQARVASGGHDVDSDKIISRYHKSLANIKALMQLCDILHVYDNTETPTRIIRKHKDSLMFFTNENWSEEAIRNLIGDATTN